MGLSLSRSPQASRRTLGTSVLALEQPQLRTSIFRIGERKRLAISGPSARRREKAFAHAIYPKRGRGPPRQCRASPRTASGLDNQPRHRWVPHCSEWQTPIKMMLAGLVLQLAGLLVCALEYVAGGVASRHVGGTFSLLCAFPSA